MLISCLSRFTPSPRCGKCALEQTVNIENISDWWAAFNHSNCIRLYICVKRGYHCFSSAFAAQTERLLQITTYYMSAHAATDAHWAQRSMNPSNTSQLTPYMLKMSCDAPWSLSMGLSSCFSNMALKATTNQMLWKSWLDFILWYTVITRRDWEELLRGSLSHLNKIVAEG